MTKELQAKYEAQLPKAESLQFGNIFNYIAGLASIGGLVSAPFIAPGEYVVILHMAFLSLLVIVLIIHAVLIEKRKLHRYAQSVFFTHFVQHLIRDSLCEIKKNDSPEISIVTMRILDAIATCFSIISGKMCRVSVIDLVKTDSVKGDFELKIAERDSMSKARSKRKNGKHFLNEDTACENLWYSRSNCSRYYLNNNIPKTWVRHEYKNSSFHEYGKPEINTIFGITHIKKWPLQYKSTLVLPIRYVSEFNPPKAEEGTVSHWDYYGFLCIDCMSVNIFDERYAPELAAMFADSLYTYFTQAEFILDKITAP